MIYTFKIQSDEVDNFSREIQVESDDFFISFNNAILEAVSFRKNVETAFVICDDDWEMGQEITLHEQNLDSDRDNYLMDDTRIDDFVERKGQKLMLVFDYENERAFYITLTQIEVGKHIDAPVCIKKTGKAPVLDIEDFQTQSAQKTTKKDSIDLDELGFGDDGGFDEDEIQDFTDTEELQDFK